MLHLRNIHLLFVCFSSETSVNLKARNITSAVMMWPCQVITVPDNNVSLLHCCSSRYRCDTTQLTGGVVVFHTSTWQRMSELKLQRIQGQQFLCYIHPYPVWTCTHAVSSFAHSQQVYFIFYSTIFFRGGPHIRKLGVMWTISKNKY